MLFLAGDADACPRDGVEPRPGDFLAAVAADTVSAFFHPVERFLDRLKDLGVGSINLLASRERHYVGLSGFGIEIDKTEIIDG